MHHVAERKAVFILYTSAFSDWMRHPTWHSITLTAFYTFASCVPTFPGSYCTGGQRKDCWLQFDINILHEDTSYPWGFKFCRDPDLTARVPNFTVSKFNVLVHSEAAHLHSFTS